jgi:hypothetical protein
MRSLRRAPGAGDVVALEDENDARLRRQGIRI